MKKTRAILALTLALLICLIPVSGVFAVEEVKEAWKYIGGWDIGSAYVANGVKATIPGADTVGGGDAWSYKAKIPNDSSTQPVFSIADGKTVTIELSVKFYNEDGTQVTTSQNSDALDIYVHDASNDAQIGLLRIWTNSGGATNGNHSCHVMGTGWDDQSAGCWIMGDATAESHFTIQVDQESFISSYVGGSDEMTPLANKELLADRREALKNVDNIYFKVGGDNGFTNSTEVVLLSVNGQSLANTDGQMTDTVAPVFGKADVMATINLGEPYTIPTEAADLIGNVSYSLKIGDEIIDGKTFTPAKAGDTEVTLVATDDAGNASEVTYTFHVVSQIAAPSIGSVPTLVDREVSYFETLVFDGATYTDETGTAQAVLKVMRGEETVKTILARDDGTFAYFISSDFVSGEYTFVYEVTNAAGTTASEPQSITLTAKKLDSVDFVSGMNGNMLAEYSKDGILLRSVQDWKEFFLGTFDISEGMDVKFVVNPQTVAGSNNDVACVSWTFVNADDDNYRVMYRVWIDHSGADRATNVYISTDGGEHYLDITDTGWISRNVDDVAGQYHMAFNMDDTFVGERTGGMTRVDNAYEKLVAFFESCPSMRFDVAMTMGNLSVEDGNYEMLVTSLNGQSFVGETITWEDAFLSVKSDIPEKIELGKTLPVTVYAKDIRGEVTIVMRVTAPDGTTSEVTIVDGVAEYAFNQLGDYTLNISTVGRNGNTVEQSYTISCRSSVSEIEIVIDGKYNETYTKGDKITIADVICSENVVEKVVTIKLPSGETITVKAGDEYTFALPGVYVLTYTARDDAEPVANENSVSVTINVPDTEKPVIDVTLPDEVNIGQSVKPVIDVRDDSECDVTVTLVKPDGSSVKLDGDYAFTADAAGEYTLKISAEDLYGNKETVEKKLTVAQANEEPSESSSPIGVIIAVVVVVVAAAAVAVILLKKRKTK